MALLGPVVVSPQLLYGTALNFQLPHRVASTFSCQTQKLGEIFLRMKKLGRLAYLDGRQSRAINPTVATVCAGPLRQVRRGTVFPGGYCYHSPGGVLMSHLSSLGTLGFPLVADISVCYGKLFPLNI